MQTALLILEDQFDLQMRAGWSWKALIEEAVSTA